MDNLDILFYELKPVKNSTKIMEKNYLNYMIDE